MSITALAGIVAVPAREAALSFLFAALFDYLSSSDLLKIFRQNNVDTDLKKWKRTLLKIHAVLEDAEEKQMTSRSVKIWLDELEDLVYDVNDILDEFVTEALRRKLHEEETSTSMIRNCIPACCVGFKLSSIKFHVGLRSKIEGINTRLQEIVTDREFLKLNDGAGGRTLTKTSRPPTSSLVEGQTYGRDKDIVEIFELLFKSSEAQLSVIPIVGMGGLGKTTLAQIVYKDDRVSRHFHLKAWVCVSEDFDILRLTNEILHSFTSESCDNNSTLDSLQVKLKNKLSENRFLLVLDGVWCESYDNWTILRKPFESGARGSIIVVTTQSYYVSSKMGTTPAYELKELSRDACLSVFTHHALGASDFSEYRELEKYGQKIVDRCMGSPLAAKAFGGLSHNKHDPYDWEDVSNSKVWDIPEIFSILKLSYNSLPSHLKSCFAYCSLFPKDNKFKEKDLVMLWMAEGFIENTNGKKPMEDLGGEYFRDLLKRSFFQQSSNRSNSESHFVMHDLMHDLAQWAAGGLYCRLEVQLGGNKQSEISRKVRHFSYIKHSNDCNQKFDDLPKDMHLWTFLQLPLYCEDNLTNFDAKYCLICLLQQLRCLRVLSLSGNAISKLQSSIGDLKHLRYLNLSHTEMKSLPKSTSSLYNLQTLILKGCFNLTKLPKKIENLINLRHLNITDASSIRKIPAGIAKLKSLQTLCFENMPEWQDWIPCEVECKKFPCLRELSISNCPKLGEFSYHLPSLEKLSIYECEHLVVSILSDSELQELKIVGCKEVVHTSLKVEKLIIENCKELTSLCEDGLMSFVTLEIKIKSCQSLVNIKLKSTLRTLTIEGCSALESLEFVMDEGRASSTSSSLRNEENLSCIGNNRASLLEHLEISDCPSLKCVSTIVDLAAVLKHLQIEKCPNLTSLSSRDTLPTSLKVLKLVDCPELESIVDELNMDTSLEEFSIICCEKIRCLPRGLLCHPKKITIRDCNSLISLEDLIPTDLRSLEIEECEKLVALPNNMYLSSLQTLSICNCPSIVSFLAFIEEGFPTNFRELRELRLSGANLCELRVFELGLHGLTSLTSLSIGYGIMYSFPEEEDGNRMLMLPTSLTTLSFENFPNLLFLSWKFFQNHSTLEKIFIGACPKLASLSEKCFPHSLQRFCICECPVLKQNYEKPNDEEDEQDKGKLWPKIAHIPSVIIDGVEQQK